MTNLISDLLQTGKLYRMTGPQELRTVATVSMATSLASGLSLSWANVHKPASVIVFSDDLWDANPLHWLACQVVHQSPLIAKKVWQFPLMSRLAEISANNGGDGTPAMTPTAVDVLLAQASAMGTKLVIIEAEHLAQCDDCTLAAMPVFEALQAGAVEEDLCVVLSTTGPLINEPEIISRVDGTLYCTPVAGEPNNKHEFLINYCSTSDGEVADPLVVQMQEYYRAARQAAG